MLNAGPFWVAVQYIGTCAHIVALHWSRSHQQPRLRQHQQSQRYLFACSPALLDFEREPLLVSQSFELHTTDAPVVELLETDSRQKRSNHARTRHWKVKPRTVTEPVMTFSQKVSHVAKFAAERHDDSWQKHLRGRVRSESVSSKQEKPRQTIFRKIRN